jgi:Ni/Fe-hydrogenase 1 B-type cytochrome subunit
MKISNWSYEILEGPPEPVYVYEAPVRFWHWTQAAAFVLLCISGFLIGWPLPANYTDTWSQYLMGHILLIHFVCAMIFTVLFIYRVYWACVGNKYSRMIFVLPVWDGMWWRGMLATIKHYLFLEPHPPIFVGHNPLAQTAMFAMYVLGSLAIILTGFGLYAEQWGWDTGWMTYFGWATHYAGGAQPLRTLHHILMYYLLIFFAAHFYMSFREDVMGHDTQLSTITNGIRYFKEPINKQKTGKSDQ